MENFEHKLIVTTLGQQIPVQAPPGVEVTILIDEDAVEEVIALDMSPDEFRGMQEQALTNEVPSVNLKAKKEE